MAKAFSSSRSGICFERKNLFALDRTSAVVTMWAWKRQKLETRHLDIGLSHSYLIVCHNN